ncbi:transglutaminase domain protein [Anaeromyxobacter sp. K]|uniref:transglutaminase domain-containing protein n=1 Tax=Anaeromyxobacter sp. (strain K) TaxID=447217 RepID=UPI00015F9B0E|nr:transglutaminase domain-containing protein [Anaeromyxobacter sp. K]ACG71420.1 transglutaminase domain protein [Anaeromyxobacter sp. K]
MIALAAAALLAALPEGQARYRVELSGEPVGAAELRVACAGARCVLSFGTWLRAPEEAGGAVRVRRIEAEVDREGRLVGAVRRTEDGAPRAASAPRGRVPASAAELALLAPSAGAARGTAACLAAFDEEGGRAGLACAGPALADGAVVLDVLGEREEVRPGPDGFPDEVRLPEQGARFVRDPAAAPPARAPRLPVRVAGPADPGRARAFCGRAVDAPAPAPPPATAPPARPGPGDCRAQAAAWIAAARRAGLEARQAVGVAHDGAGFTWHAWAEVRGPSGWIAIDPAFGEAPARGPRFTVARFTMGDEAARAAAGREILACWGRGRVR